MTCLYCFTTALPGSRYCAGHLYIPRCAVLSCGMFADAEREDNSRCLCADHRVLFHNTLRTMGDFLATQEIPHVVTCPLHGCSDECLPNADRCYHHRGVQQTACIITECHLDLGVGAVFCPGHGQAMVRWQQEQRPRLSNEAAFNEWLALPPAPVAGPEAFGTAFTQVPTGYFIPATCQREGCERSKFEETVDGVIRISASCSLHVCGDPDCMLGAISDEISLCPHHHEVSRQAIAASQEEPVDIQRCSRPGCTSESECWHPRSETEARETTWCDEHCPARHNAGRFYLNTARGADLDRAAALIAGEDIAGEPSIARIAAEVVGIPVSATLTIAPSRWTPVTQAEADATLQTGLIDFLRQHFNGRPLTAEVVNALQGEVNVYLAELIAPQADQVEPLPIAQAGALSALADDRARNSAGPVDDIWNAPATREEDPADVLQRAAVGLGSSGWIVDRTTLQTVVRPHHILCAKHTWGVVRAWECSCQRFYSEFSKRCISGQCNEQRRPGGALCERHFAELQKS